MLSWLYKRYIGRNQAAVGGHDIHLLGGQKLLHDRNNSPRHKNCVHKINSVHVVCLDRHSLEVLAFASDRLNRFDLGVCVTANFFVPKLRFRKKCGKEVLFARSFRHMLNTNGYLRCCAAPKGVQIPDRLRMFTCHVWKKHSPPARPHAYSIVWHVCIMRIGLYRIVVSHCIGCSSACIPW